MTRRRLLLAPVWPCASIIFLAAGATSATADQPASPPSASSTITLDDAIALSTSDNPTVNVARQQWAQARARVDEARAATRVTVSFNSTAGESNADVATPPPASESFGSIVNSITLPLPIGRKPGVLVSEADAQADAAEASYAGAVRTQTNAVIAAYFDLLKKESQLSDAQLAFGDAQRQQDEAEKRNKAGDVPDLDVIRAEVPVASAQAAVAEAASAVDIARETLNAAIGRPISTPVDVVATAEEAPTSLTQEDVERRAVDNSADVTAARSTLSAEQSAYEAAKLWREPQIALTASDARSGDVTALSRQDMIAASITVPLSDGGLASGQRREAEAAITQAKAQVDASTLSTQAAAASAYHNAVTTRQVAETVKTALDLAQTAYDKTMRGYQNGLFPLTDLLSAQAALAQTRGAYTEALYDAGAAQATLDAMMAPAQL